MSRQEQRSYEFGRYRLVPRERLLLLDGEPVPLTPKAFEMLVALVRRGGRLVEKNELLSEVWPETSVEESNIAQNVFALRRALGRSNDGVWYIETVPKRGYRFLSPVTVLEDDGGELRAAGIAPAPTELKPGAPRRRSMAIVVGALALAALIAILVVARARLTRSAIANETITLSLLMSGTRIPSAAISPDGRYFAHVAETGDRHTILVRQVSTVTDLEVVSPEVGSWYWGLTFSRDGDSLYYVKSKTSEPVSTLYRVSALGGTSVKIVSGIDSHVALSADSKQIAFVRESPGANALIVANADGTGERVLATQSRPQKSFSASPRGGPSWSPDGKTIATGVISLEGGYHGEVVLIAVSNGEETPLTKNRWYQVAQVAWLSDGSGLAVTARGAGNTQVWHVSFPSGEARRIATDILDYHDISLTADSQSLMAVQYDRRSALAFIPEKPASAILRNTEGMDEGFYGMSWTPNGDLVYASNASGDHDIWFLGRDSITARQLTSDPESDTTPSVSPDGRAVVFLSRRDGGNPHVWRMDLDGASPQQLTNQVSEGTPSFTPDGQWVVYAAVETGIWKVPAEGGEPAAVAMGPYHTPSVSPDGKRLVCFTGEQLALLPTLEGTAPTRLIPAPEDLSRATIRWTSDGRSLIYVSTRNGVSNLRTLPLDGSAPQDLTRFTSDLIYNFAWSKDNQQLALARGKTAEYVVLIRNFR